MAIFGANIAVVFHQKFCKIVIEIDINKLKKYLSFLVINSHSPSFKSLKKSTIMHSSDRVAVAVSIAVSISAASITVAVVPLLASIATCSSVLLTEPR